jgi:hypothetical protein
MGDFLQTMAATAVHLPMRDRFASTVVLRAGADMAGPFKIAGTVESWCGRCKLMLHHTIETLEGGVPGRVHCNTCQSQHTYKPHLPGESPRDVKRRERDDAGGPRAPRPGLARASHYDELMRGRDPAFATPYSPKTKYEPGAVIAHPTFGVGVVTALKDGGKVEVLFPEGPRVLIHGR